MSDDHRLRGDRAVRQAVKIEFATGQIRELETGGTATGGIDIPSEQILPFFLAARSATHPGKDLLGEALCSSYEAFRHTRRDNTAAKDDVSEGDEVTDLTHSSWFLAEFDEVISGCSGTVHPKVHATVQKAVDYIHEARDREGRGTWRYDVPSLGDSDTSITGWMVFALESAQEAGLEVESQALTDSLLWIEEVTDPEAAVKGAKVVYSDVWTSMGQEEEAKKRLVDLADYQINEHLFGLADDDAIFMHCLPAHRGEEVTDAVVDHERSVVFDQAENRLHTQKAVMALLMGL